MQAINPTTLYKINPNTAYTFIDEEAVLMPPETEALLGSNPTATLIWKRLEAAPTSLQSISDYLTETFEVSAETSLSDTSSFLASLLEHELIVEA